MDRRRLNTEEVDRLCGWTSGVREDLARCGLVPIMRGFFVPKKLVVAAIRRGTCTGALFGPGEVER